MAFTSVLCSVDFSEHSREALRVAAMVAARRGATLRVVHAIDLLLAEAAAAAYDEQHLRDEATSDLRAFVSRELDLSGPGTEPALEIRIGRPDREILEAAIAADSDLIVMGTHGLGGFRKLFFGSVTERVLRATTIAVLAVPLDERRRLHPSRPAIASVLGAIDLDHMAIPLAVACRTVAAALNVRLTLLHAVPPLRASGAWTGPFDKGLAQRLETANLTLDHIARSLDEAHPPKVMICSGSPAEEIAAAAAELPNVLVTVGLAGSGVLHRPGSTAYRVLTLSPAPVLGLPFEAVARLTTEDAVSVAAAPLQPGSAAL